MRLTVTRAATAVAKVGIATGAEIMVGFNTYTMFAGIGLSAIIAASATLFSIIKLTGEAYLIWLRIRVIRTGAPVISGFRASSNSAQLALCQAVLTDVLIPKTALFFLDFLLRGVRPENGSVLSQLMILRPFFSLLGYISRLVFAVGTGGLERLL